MKTCISLFTIAGMLSAAQACTVQVRHGVVNDNRQPGLTQANCDASCSGQFESDATSHVNGVDRSFESFFSASTYFYDSMDPYSSTGEYWLCSPEFKDKYGCFVYYDAQQGNGPQRIC
ncbi:hypothetical protein CKM354_000002400 [Cercospora kikuchii]|uniref:Uncharacterized protein n=1 Tax=Cercospora kikuchii TaxID=84275 RepID=A0A9P3CD31_9PEZI|nr:uncharacterized protein CKM354_000002400 [Cercospora kikuchii]GIZ36553.1 hypothetical protein CKM354_000002400 [Cercospora kikuchii]